MSIGLGADPAASGSSIVDCSMTVRSDGSFLYEAGVDGPEDGQPWAEVEWFLDGELAARDGPLSISGSWTSDFKQPREDGFTGNELYKITGASQVQAGEHTITAELKVSESRPVTGDPVDTMNCGTVDVPPSESALLYQSNSIGKQPPYNVGELLTVSVTVENEGLSDGQVSDNVIVNNAVVGTIEGTVPGGETRTLSTTIQIPDVNSVSIKTEHSGTVVTGEVLQPNIIVTDLSISPDSPWVIGNDVTATVTAENQGDVTGSTSFNVAVNGSNVGDVSFSLDPGQTGQSSTTVTVPDATEMSVDVRAANVTGPVLDPALVSISDCGISPQNIAPQEEVTLTADVANDNAAEIDVTVEWEVSGASESQTKTIPANSTKSFSATTPVLSEGEHTATATLSF